MYLSTVPYIRLQVSPVPVGQTSFDVNNPGWHIWIINDATASADDTLTYWNNILYGMNEDFDIAWQGMGAEQVHRDTKCYPDVKIISFVGDLGEETLMFTGLHSKKGHVDKSFFRTVNRIRKVLKAYKYRRMILRSMLDTIYAYPTLNPGTLSSRNILRKLLYQLAYTEKDVWMYDADESAGYKEVTVISDEVEISEQDDIIESEIEIEYYE